MSETASQPNYSWVSLSGQFDATKDEITFRGYTFTPEVPTAEGQGAAVPTQQQTTLPSPPAEPRGGVGRIVSNQRLTDGAVSVDIEFEEIDLNTTAEVMVHYDPVKDEMLTVGLGANGLLLNVRHWTQTRATEDTAQQTGRAGENAPRWKVLRSAGDRSTMMPGRSYHIDLNVQGSFLTVEVDGVELGSGELPFQLSGKQVGLFCQSKRNIRFRHFQVESAKPLAFVVMQFDPPEYEELFNEVIVPVCDNMGLEAFRASQTYYPGLVIADIQRQIRESRVVIAEITPVNPNVYYEVGYADAIGKPVILIADGAKLDQLPFDVRAFRTLFYENTIGGKKKVEKTLTEFLRNIMSQKT